MGPADHKAEIGNLIFDQRYTSIASGKQIKLHGFAQFAGLFRRQAQVQLEAGEIAVYATRAVVSAQVVFAGG